MPSLQWVHRPEMSLFAGAQQAGIRDWIHEQGWDVRTIPYRPRMMWRKNERCDVLAWSFVPTQLDIWSARLNAAKQIGVIHELDPATSNLPHLEHWIVPSKGLSAALRQRGIEVSKISLLDSMPKLQIVSSPSSSNNIRKDLGLQAETRLVFVGGPLLVQTGARLAIWAHNILNYLHPEVHLLLQGTGIEQERLEEFMRSVNQQKRTHLLPASYAVSDIISQVDQVWIPRQWDGVPDLLFYALQAGAVILASDQVSLREWLMQDKNGLLLPADQPPAWAAAAHQLLADPQKSSGFRKAAQQTPSLHANACVSNSLGWFVNAGLQPIAA